MPHGGGHIGGGHHGGGGGGGFHHHHHHHHGHYGGVVYTSGPFFYGRYRYRGWIWGGVGIVTVICIVIAVVLSVHYGGETNDENMYTPYDTRLHYFSTFFYSGATVRSQDIPINNNGTLYLLQEKPPLTSRNVFSFNDSFTIDGGEYRYWHFYLYPNSNFTLRACVIGTSYTFYIIKGTSKFKQWIDSPSTSKSVKHLLVSQSCDDDDDNSMSYTATEEDHYYFVYYYDGYNRVSGKQFLSFERYEYSVPDSNVIADQCSFTATSSCKLTTNFRSKYNKLLIVMPSPSNVDWNTEQYQVYYSSHNQPLGYVIVIVPPVLVVVVIVIAIIIAIICCRRAKKRSYNPLIAETISASPPPYNPKYPSDLPPPP